MGTIVTLIFAIFAKQRLSHYGVSVKNMQINPQGDQRLVSRIVDRW